MGKARNPFSVQHHGPGNIPFLFPANDPEGFLRLLARLDGNGWRLEIAGPQGVGKSTLLRTLEMEARRRRWSVAFVRLTEDQSWPPLLFWLQAMVARVVFVDSAERAPAWMLRALARMGGIATQGLIVTSHNPRVLPETLILGGDAESFRRILAHLLGEAAEDLTPPAEAWLEAAHGNVRRALFDLYEAFERDAVYTGRPTKSADGP